MPTALITGASYGIGRELAGLFARDRYQLILVARDREKLEEVSTQCARISEQRVEVLPMDLADRAAPQRIFDAVRERGMTVDALVNNAGFGLNGPFPQIPLDQQLNMIQVNVTALVQLTHLFLPGMIERDRGGILNVASTAAFQPGPLMAIYYATKAFVLSFSEALDEELRRTRVRVTAVCPGPTHTEFQKRAGLGQARMFASKFLQILDAPTVARLGYDGFKAGRRVVVTGAMNKLHTTSVRFAPRKLVTRIAASVNRSKR